MESGHRLSIIWFPRMVEHKKLDSKCFLIPEDAIAITLSQGSAKNLLKLLQCIENICQEKKVGLMEYFQLTNEVKKNTSHFQENASQPGPK